MELRDAHCHYHFAEVTRDAVAQARAAGLGRAMINGTSPADWDAVAERVLADPRHLAPFGLHPWHAASAPPGWADGLRARLIAHPAAGVGEIGLDHRVEGHDPAVQERAFRTQLALAAELDRPASVHCVRAFGALASVLRSADVPARGFLLHAWGGPAELVPELVRRGAYFSFGPGHLSPRRAALAAQFAAAIPRDRVLAETDAPSGGARPADLVAAHAGLARIWGVAPDAAAATASANFARLFGA